MNHEDFICAPPFKLFNKYPLMKLSEKNVLFLLHLFHNNMLEPLICYSYI